MSFGDGIAAEQAERKAKHGSFWAWVLLLRDFAVIGGTLLTFLAVAVATISTLADWATGSDTLVHVISANLAWLWHLLGRIV